MKALTQSEFIEKANLKHSFKFDYSKFIYVNKKNISAII
jgi:hypothetical protein